MKLFIVRIETEIVVAAEDADAAAHFAAGITQDLDDYRIAATPMTRLPDGWTIDVAPWGYHELTENQDRTIDEWIDAGAAPEYKP